MRRSFALLAIAGLLAGPTAAGAAWRVVGPGMAVNEARSGNASLVAECIGDGLVLGVYNVKWDFGHAEEIALVIDGHAYTVRQYGSGDRIVLADADSKGGNLDLSAPLRAALKSGREAHLEGKAVDDMDPKTLAFGLLGSETAIKTVEKFCK